jgi:hypothetical protein
MGRYATGFGAGRLPPKNAELAFGNVVSFNNGSLGHSCTGAFAYEPVSATQANIYFYTAAHCFEKTTPLGFTLIPLSKAGVNISALAGGPKKFLKPFGAANIAPVPVKVGTVESLYEGSIRGDIVRILQGQTTLALAKKSYLPSCASFDSSASKDLAIGAMAVDSAGIIQANSKRDVRMSGLGVPLTSQFPIPSSGLGTIVKLDEVSSIPGESGAPVWLMSGKEKWNEMTEYLCLQGVVSREVISAEIQATGAYELEPDSYFTPVMRPTTTTRWVTIK